MANIYDVANFFIELAGQDDEGEITNLKLNKLLYYAQGHYLAALNKPLFTEAIEAWDLGPVIPAIYQKYKICGKNSIAAEGKDIAENFSDEEYSFLLDIAREYGKYTAAYLVNKTHEPDSPWAQTNRNEVINIEQIAAYFSANERIKPFKIKLNDSKNIAIGHRDSEGFLVLPADENDDYWDNYNEA
ncbi:MAG: DUF4065 domain-containing protein [Lachnospiraceae bacterium]|nr:DUF4065 domain-containing protein [Lachnospiraceae bacterium]